MEQGTEEVYKTDSSGEQPNGQQPTGKPEDKACYENPLFEEDGGVNGETQTKLHGQPDGLRTKPYDLQGAQTSVHFKQRTSRTKRGLYLIGVAVAVIAIIAIIVAIIVGQRDGDEDKPENERVLYKSRALEVSLRIYKGPFSVFTREYNDPSSTSFAIFNSSFTYQMRAIFDDSVFSSSYFSTEIVNISSGSVAVNFIVYFHQDLEISRRSSVELVSVIDNGLRDTLFIVEPNSIVVKPIAIPVITTPKPGVCLPLPHLVSCANMTSWSETTFPNVLGHTGPNEVLHFEAMHAQMTTMDPCSKDFWCIVLNPKCHNGRALPPCRSYCQNVVSKCGDYISHFLSCDSLPHSIDPNVCIRDPFRPGICQSSIGSTCEDLYPSITFPNWADQRTKYQARGMTDTLHGINQATQCYRHTHLFVCSAFLPKCTDGGKPVPPCRSLCENFRARCEVFMDIFYHHWPDTLTCDSFPDSSNTSICLGYAEARELEPPSMCLPDESLCDNGTCIMNRWRCDDYQDCQDGSDEAALQTKLPLKTCAVCPSDMFRCSPKSTACVSNTGRCDGKTDCTTGSDEQECVRLDDGGRSGVLNVYNPDSGMFEPVCTDGWTQANSVAVCSQLGYHEMASMSSTDSTTSSMFVLDLQTSPNETNIQSRLIRGGTCTSQKVVTIECDVPVCGIRPAYIRPLLRIVGGDLADPDAWPWQVSLYGGPDRKYFCGGSIIAENWILTAAHCMGGIRKPTEVLVRAGQPRRDTYSRYLQELHPEKIFVYEHYNHMTVDNDIALIYLKDAIKFNDHVRPVCLPPTSNRPPVGERCTVIGWGKRNSTAMYYERQLKQVYLEVVNQKDCRDAIIGSKVIVPYELNDHMFCAGGGLGHDACAGDSGGPFLCSMDEFSDVWYVAGIVSWGLACAFPNVPGVYTNLPGYLDWVRNTTAVPYI